MINKDNTALKLFTETLLTPIIGHKGHPDIAVDANDMVQIAWDDTRGGKVELVFVIDGSGSMGTEWADVCSVVYGGNFASGGYFQGIKPMLVEANMTVYENVRFPLKIRKVPKENHNNLVMEAINLVELNDFCHRKPSELSGGQKQRVALARALVRKPNVFLMDEPLSNLDAKLRVSTRGQIKHLQNKLQITTIYVTHDQIEAMTLADRVVVMDKGVIQQIGTPKQIYDKPINTFVASFIGNPPMNLINGNIKDNNFIAKDIKIENFNHKNGKYKLGFRAEDGKIIKSISGNIKGPIFSIELLGDATMVTVKIEENFISVKMSNTFDASIGDVVSISILSSKCQIFDDKTGVNLS